MVGLRLANSASRADNNAVYSLQHTSKTGFGLDSGNGCFVLPMQPHISSQSSVLIIYPSLLYVQCRFLSFFSFCISQSLVGGSRTVAAPFLPSGSRASSLVIGMIPAAGIPAFSFKLETRLTVDSVQSAGRACASTFLQRPSPPFRSGKAASLLGSMADWHIAFSESPPFPSPAAASAH